MKSFNFGVFAFDKIEVTKQFETWSLTYEGSDKHENLATRAIYDAKTRGDVISSFSDCIEEFKNSLELKHGLQYDRKIYLQKGDEEIDSSPWVIEIDDKMVDSDDDSFWICTESGRQLMSVSIKNWTNIKAAQLYAKKQVPENEWIAQTLPEDVLTDNSDEWRAPTSDEIRQVVGEGSLTGISGAKAAELVGVNPQSFRKYTAQDGSKTQQKMSFSMWHYLLHKLKVKNA